MNAETHPWLKAECVRMINEMRDSNSTYAQDTATIARLQDVSLARYVRIEEMRLEIYKLVLELQRGAVPGITGDESALILRLETIRGEPA